MIRQDLRRYDLPDEPGVYFFKHGADILYIGRATSLRDRVRSYFSDDLFASRGPRLVDMVAKADDLSWQAVGSVLESIVLEAALIQKHDPPYNTDGKDNKSFMWVILSDEDFPQVRLVRGRELALWQSGAARPPVPIRRAFGPFQSAAVVSEALRIIRRILPYRDEKCSPPLPGKRARPCFNRHLGLCPGVCVGAIGKTEYGRTVRRLSLLLGGKVGAFRATLERDMRAAASTERFEEASALKRARYAFDHLSDVRLLKREDTVTREADGGPVAMPRVSRVEAYDVAHLKGGATRAVMVVLLDGSPMKSKYRTFIPRSSAPGDDIGVLREVLTRRAMHEEWGLPDLVVVDGGAPHLAAAKETLAASGLSVPIVAVTKGVGHRPRALVGDAGLIARFEGDILLANAEAHRFSIGRHRRGLRRALRIDGGQARR